MRLSARKYGVPKGSKVYFLLEQATFVVEHGLAHSSSCSSTNTSCSGMIEFVLGHEYFVQEHELDCDQAQHFVLKHKLDRARAQSLCSSTNICARAENLSFDPFGTP